VIFSLIQLPRTMSILNQNSAQMDGANRA